MSVGRRPARERSRCMGVAVAVTTMRVRRSTRAGAQGAVAARSRRSSRRGAGNGRAASRSDGAARVGTGRRPRPFGRGSPCDRADQSQTIRGVRRSRGHAATPAVRREGSAGAAPSSARRSEPTRGCADVRPGANGRTAHGPRSAATSTLSARHGSHASKRGPARTAERSSIAAATGGHAAVGARRRQLEASRRRAGVEPCAAAR